MNEIVSIFPQVDLSDAGTQEAESFRKEVQLLMRLRDKRRIVHVSKSSFFYRLFYVKISTFDSFRYLTLLR